MATSRFSRPNPYILPAADVQYILRAMTPDIQQQIAKVIGISYEEWEILSSEMKAKHFVDWQNGGAMAATTVQIKRAYNDLADLANPVVQSGEGSPLPSSPSEPTQPVLRIAQKAI